MVRCRDLWLSMVTWGIHVAPARKMTPGSGGFEAQILSCPKPPLLLLPCMFHNSEENFKFLIIVTLQARPERKNGK